jgi:hypothetical protein
VADSHGEPAELSLVLIFFSELLELFNEVGDDDAT